MELNRVERRALLIASSLVVLGAAVRLGVGSSEATWAWRPSAEAAAGLDSTRARVQREIERAERIATPLADGERLDPNLAPDEELQRLPGIGPGKAAAIIEARRAGPFLSADELTRVPGLGPVTVQRLRPHLRFTPDAAQSGPQRAGSAQPATGSEFGLPAADIGILDLNHAQPVQLERLPGLGPARAQAIVDYRKRNGPFGSIEEITSVPGIGSALLEQLRPRLRVR